MRKLVLAVWIVITLSITLSYAAIQGDFVINGVDATTSTKFYRIPASVANGLRVDVTRISAGTKTPADAFVNPTDAMTSWSLNGLYNGATWDFMRESAIGAGALLVGGNTTPSDAFTNSTAAIASWSLTGIWNGATWNRWSGVANNADNVAVTTTNVIPQVVAYPMMFNGTTQDRLRGNSTDGLQVFSGRVASAVVTMFTGTTVETTISAASSTRRMLLIYNEGTDICYIKLGSGASTTSYSFKMTSGEKWEMPTVTYSGIVTAIWSAGTNTTIVTSY